MNFRKKTIGNILNLSHVWVAKRGGNLLLIRFDEKQGKFWFEVTREEETVYDSAQKGEYFNTLDETENYVEGWVQEKLFGRVKKKARLSMEKKYLLLLNAVKEYVARYSQNPGADELATILKKINES